MSARESFCNLERGLKRSSKSKAKRTEIKAYHDLAEANELFCIPADFVVKLLKNCSSIEIDDHPDVQEFKKLELRLEYPIKLLAIACRRNLLGFCGSEASIVQILFEILLKSRLVSLNFKLLGLEAIVLLKRGNNFSLTSTQIVEGRTILNEIVEDTLTPKIQQYILQLIELVREFLQAELPDPNLIQLKLPRDFVKSADVVQKKLPQRHETYLLQVLQVFQEHFNLESDDDVDLWRISAKIPEDCIEAMEDAASRDELNPETKEYALKWLEILNSNLLEVPEHNDIVNILEKLPPKNDENTKLALVRGLSLTLKAGQLISDGLLLRIIDRGASDELQTFISQIVGHAFRIGQIGQVVLERLDEVEFTADLVKALAEADNSKLLNQTLILQTLIANVHASSDAEMMTTVLSIFRKVMKDIQLMELKDDMVDFALGVLIAAEHQRLARNILAFLEDAMAIIGVSASLKEKVAKYVDIERQLADSGADIGAILGLLKKLVDDRCELTQNCFKFLEQLVALEEDSALEILGDIIDQDLQRLPGSLIDKLFKTEQVGLLDRLLQSGNIDELKANELCLSLLNRSSANPAVPSFLSHCLNLNLSKPELPSGNVGKIAELAQCLPQASQLALMSDFRPNQFNSASLHCLESILKRPDTFEVYLMALVMARNLHGKFEDEDINKLLVLESGSLHSMTDATQLTKKGIIPWLSFQFFCSRLAKGELDLEERLQFYKALNELQAIPSLVVKVMISLLHSSKDPKLRSQLRLFFRNQCIKDPSKLGDLFPFIEDMLRKQERLESSKLTQVREGVEALFEEAVEYQQRGLNLSIDQCEAIIHLLSTIDLGDENLKLKIVHLLALIPDSIVASTLTERSIDILADIAGSKTRRASNELAAALLLRHVIQPGLVKNWSKIGTKILHCCEVLLESQLPQSRSIALKSLNMLSEIKIPIPNELFLKALTTFSSTLNGLKKTFQEKLQKINDISKGLYILAFLSSSKVLYPKIIKQYEAKDWIVEFCLQDLVMESIEQNDEVAIQLFYEQIGSLRKQLAKQPEVLEKIMIAIRSDDQKNLRDIAISLGFLNDKLELQQIIACFAHGKLRWYQKVRKLWLSNFLKESAGLDQLCIRLTNVGWDSASASLFFKTAFEGSTTFEQVCDFLSFCARNNVSDFLVDQTLKTKSGEIKPIFDGEPNLSKWHRFISHVLIFQRAAKAFNNKELARRIATLVLNRKLSFGTISEFFRNLPTNYDDWSEPMACVLTLLEDFNVELEIGDQVLAQLCQIRPPLWEKQTHQLVIKATFEGGQERDLDELVRLIEEKTPELKGLNLKLKIEQIEQKFQAKHGSKILTEKSSKIAKWSESDILQWSQQVRRTSDSKIFEIEALAVLKRAVELCNPFPVRTVQLLSLLCLLGGKGRLAQINTGEGKSLIVAMFAVLKALQGKKVDVVTTSTELSVPEAKKQSKFFAMFGLTVGDNSDPKERMNVYRRDVVYGAVGDFQGDVLRNDFLQQGTRSGRPFQVVCVDEVDSMLIDGRSHCVQLSGPMPAMNFLELPLASIWHFLNRLQRHFVKGLGNMPEQLFFVVEDFKIENEELVILSGNEPDRCLLPVDDPKSFIEEKCKDHLGKLLRKLAPDEQLEYDEYKKAEENSLRLQDEWARLRDEDLAELKKADGESNEAFQKRYDDQSKQWEQHAKIKESRSISDNMSKLKWFENNRYPVMLVPCHLQDFARTNYVKWIESAMAAKYTYKKGQHYDVQNERIVPIDYSNTGVLQGNMVWSEGLCQFLQLKEGLKLTPEQLSTNFISNVHFFQKYGQEIYGLTGTLGSKESQNLLKQVYKVDVCIIPPYKENKIASNSASNYICKELQPKLVQTSEDSDWYEAVAESCLAKIHQGQACLVICKFVKQVRTLHELLIEKGADRLKLFLYTGHGNFTKRSIECGEMIIATNIAGRGTDIKTSEELEKNGGLHVCVTFMPDNLRVELQNVGRTAREGHNGTAQLIILDPSKDGIEKLREKRDKEEREGIANALKDVDSMLFKDELFGKFCDLQNELFPHTNQEQTEPDAPDLTEERHALQELWAIWLRNVDNYPRSAENFDMEKFHSEKRSDFSAWSQSLRDKWNNQRKIIENPFYHVAKGLSLFDKKKHAEAIVEFDEAIKLDSVYSLNARYNKAAAILHINGKHDNQTKALNELLKARLLIKQYMMPDLLTFHSLLASTPPDAKDHGMLISIQVQNQIDIVGLTDNYIDSNIKTIQGAMAKGWKVTISHVLLDKLFDDYQEPHSDELKEAETNSLVYMYQLQEKEPTPWGKIIAVACLGLVQLLAGAALVVFTGPIGAHFGMALITEGVNDLIYAVKSAITGEFSWEEWGIQKAVSMTISLVTAGFGAIKTSAHFAKAGIVGAKTIGAGFAKEGAKLAIRQVGLQIAKGVAKEALNQLANYVLDKTILSMIEELIAEKVAESVIIMLEKNDIVRQALEIDHANKSNYFQSKLIHEGLQLLNPDRSRLAKYFNALVAVGKGIASCKGKATARALQVADSTVILAKIPIIMAKFEDEFNNMCKTDIKFEIEKKLKQQQQQQEEKQKKSSNLTQKETTNSDAAKKTKSTHFDDEVAVCDVQTDDNYTSQQQQASKNNAGEGKKPSSTAKIAKPYSAAISRKMMALVKQGFVQPVVTSLTSMGVEKMAEQYQQRLNDEMSTYHSKRMVVSMNNDIAKATAKIESISNVKTAKPTAKLIEDTLNDGEGGLQHAGAVSAKFGRPVEMYDAKGKKMTTVGGHQKGEPIRLQYDSKQKHWAPMTPGCEQVATGPKNCFFDAVAAELGQDGLDGSEVRQMVGSEMLANAGAYSKMAPLIEQLRSKGDDTVLLMGGMYWTDQAGNNLKDRHGNDLGKVTDLTDELKNQYGGNLKVKTEEKDIPLLEAAANDAANDRGPPEVILEVKKSQQAHGKTSYKVEPALANPNDPKNETGHHLKAASDLRENLVKKTAANFSAKTQAEKDAILADADYYFNQPRNLKLLADGNLLAKFNPLTNQNYDHGQVMYTLVINDNHNMATGLKTKHQAASMAYGPHQQDIEDSLKKTFMDKAPGPGGKEVRTGVLDGSDKVLKGLKVDKDTKSTHFQRDLSAKGSQIIDSALGGSRSADAKQVLSDLDKTKDQLRRNFDGMISSNFDDVEQSYDAKNARNLKDGTTIIIPPSFKSGSDRLNDMTNDFTARIMTELLQDSDKWNYRRDDPGNATDHKIVEQQSPDFQAKFGTFDSNPTFRTMADLPKPVSVDFRHGEVVDKRASSPP